MSYIKLVIAIDDKYQEALIAQLEDLEFNGYEQRDNELIAYIDTNRMSGVSRERVEDLLKVYPGDGYIKSEEVIEEQNWNEQWEQTIQPQTIGQFYVKPTWAQATTPNDKILLEIDPKMSFGTGYHATTRLMLRMLEKSLEEGDTVLDAGTGTGILAIASVKLGGAMAIGFDIDEWSYQNAVENTYLNKTKEQTTFYHGSIHSIPSGTFDLVLANINRNTILDILEELVERCVSGGLLVLSGLQQNDRSIIVRQSHLDGFELVDEERMDEWIALKFQKG